MIADETISNYDRTELRASPSVGGDTPTKRHKKLPKEEPNTENRRSSALRIRNSMTTQQPNTDE
jgi:hypothetical protein